MVGIHSRSSALSTAIGLVLAASIGACSGDDTGSNAVLDGSTEAATDSSSDRTGAGGTDAATGTGGTDATTGTGGTDAAADAVGTDGATGTGGAVAPDASDGAAEASGGDASPATGDAVADAVLDVVAADAAATDAALDATVTFAAVQSIFARCTGCHSTQLHAPSGGLDMVVNGVRSALVNVAAGFCADRKYVAPGQPDQSYVINAVTGQFPPVSATCTNNAVDGGTPMSRMPLNCSADGGSNPCLTAAEIQLLRDWIAGGANP